MGGVVILGGSVITQVAGEGRGGARGKGDHEVGRGGEWLKHKKGKQVERGDRRSSKKKKRKHTRAANW